MSPMDEKDRLGDKLREKERADEDRYFAERDRALLEKIRSRSEQTRDTALREIARGRCPKCGQRLSERKVESVSVEQCASCRGVWLDEGELKELSRRETEGWLGRSLRRLLEETR